MLTRREYLATSGLAGTIATAGCLTWFRDDDQDQDDGRNQDDSRESEQEGADAANDQGEEHMDQNDTAQNDTQNRERNESTESNESADTDANDTESEPERQREPTEEQTEIDRDEFDGGDGEPADTEERPADHVETEVDREGIERADGMISVSGTVTNVSDEPIDAVDIELVFLDADGREVGRELRTVRDLGAGETETWGIRTVETTLRGEPERVRPEARPMDYVGDADAVARRKWLLQVVDDHMDRHRELYDKLARE